MNRSEVFKTIIVFYLKEAGSITMLKASIKFKIQWGAQGRCVTVLFLFAPCETHRAALGDKLLTKAAPIKEIQRS